MRRVAAALVASVCLLVASATSAQGAFPSKPIHVIVPSPPGGPPDLIIRMLAPKLGEGLGQPIVVENRAGAGGIVGTAYLARQPADGYTWLFTTASHTNIPPFNENVPYDPVKDFTHVTLAAQNFGQALIVNPSVPAKTVQELIALAKKEPGKLTYASAGIGTASHIPAEVMKAQTGTDILMVPYRGVAEAMTDLLAGRVDMFFVGTQIALQHVEAGKVRALAVTGSKRWKGMPDVPTMQEAGLKDFDIVNWFGLWLPAGAPKDVVTRIHAEMTKALADPGVQREFDKLGLEGVGSSPEDFARFVARESAQTQAIARRIGARPAAK
ncbi:MAG TPA: tripartite tricarboxylate transporter substrate binding protein [Casimicrobiaceae bacterium]|jgi:tripartite-type tricarboxylate transporter receptor subunit TctC|nr:tripartite tricarboxylate transporter substrate binding protein [Casimicrobiaceae bacterium]